MSDEAGAAAAAEPTKKTPLSREQLLKYIKTQKGALKKAEDAKLQICSLLELSIGKEDWSGVVSGVTAAVSGNHDQHATGSEELKWRDEELKSRGDRMRDMALEIEELKNETTSLKEERSYLLESVQTMSAGQDAISKKVEAAWAEAETLRVENLRLLEKLEAVPAAGSADSGSDEMMSVVHSEAIASLKAEHADASAVLQARVGLWPRS